MEKYTSLYPPKFELEKQYCQKPFSDCVYNSNYKLFFQRGFKPLQIFSAYSKTLPLFEMKISQVIFIVIYKFVYDKNDGKFRNNQR